MFVSCEKETILLENPTDSSITMNIEGIQVGSENGYLVLNSFEDAEKLAIQINKLGVNGAIEWTRSHGIKSMKDYFEDMNNLALTSSIDSVIGKIVLELNIRGYYNENDSSVGYPTYLSNLASILNENGLIKIKGVLYRFINSDIISVEDNDLIKLSRVRGREDYERYGVDYKQVYFNLGSKNELLKSSQVETYIPYNLVSYDTVAGVPYRATANVYCIYYEDASYPYGDLIVTSCRVLIQVELHKKWSGIWWRYHDYFYDRKRVAVIGGNPATTYNPVYTYELLEFYNPTADYETNQLQDWVHVNTLYSSSPFVYALNFMIPDIIELNYSWHSIKIPESQWITF